VGPCNRDKEEICSKKEKGVSTIKEEERRGVRVHQRTIEERVYQILKIISNSTSIFCRKKEQ